MKKLFLLLLIPCSLSAQYIEVGAGQGINDGVLCTQVNAYFFENQYDAFAGWGVSYYQFENKADIMLGWKLCSPGKFQFYAGNSIGLTLWSRERDDYFQYDFYGGVKYSASFTAWIEAGYGECLIRAGIGLKINLR